jgi:hypothetical protein
MQYQYEAQKNNNNWAQNQNGSKSMVNSNQMQYFQSQNQKEHLQDDSWYKTTTDEEGEDQPNSGKTAPSQVSQHANIQQPVLTQQNIQSHQISYQNGQQPPMSRVQTVNSYRPPTLVGHSSQIVRQPIMRSCSESVSRHSTGNLENNHQVNGPVLSQPRMPAPQSFQNSVGPASKQQIPLLSPRPQMAFAQPVRMGPQTYMTASSRPVQQFAMPLNIIEQPDERIDDASSIGQPQMNNRQNNLNSQQFPPSYNRQNSNPMQYSANAGNNMSMQQNTETFSQPNMQNNYQQQNGPITMNNGPIHNTVSQNTPPLPPKPTGLLSSSSSTNNKAENSERKGNGDPEQVEDVLVVEADGKWMPPKAQLRAEHQTRMGFLFRDMNLKASQC